MQRAGIIAPNPDEIKRELLRLDLEEDLFQYLLWVFKEIYKQPFEKNWHHLKITEYLCGVFLGSRTHLIINVPPRYSKTELVIKAFVSWCIAKRPICKFIHLSYSDDLALDNSSSIKETILSDKYQEMWPITLKADSKSKKKWYTEQGGGVYATSMNGQITGFGAGGIGNDFEGAILIDDPIKPLDARSETIRNTVNSRFNSTIKSRANNPAKTPIIVIMQRVHENDFTGFLLNGGSEYEWDHLNLPAINENGPTEDDPREFGEALWPAKHTEDQLDKMKSSDSMTFSGQYQQRPAPIEGAIIKKKWLKRFWEDIPTRFDHIIQSWDLTFKKSAKADYVVGQVWGLVGADRYLLDQTRGRMDFPETIEAIRALSIKWPKAEIKIIEDKANGPAVMSTLKKELAGIIPFSPDVSKEARLSAVSMYFEAGNVVLPHISNAPWVQEYIHELTTFPNGVHDDQVDATSQALLRFQNASAGKWSDNMKQEQKTIAGSISGGNEW